MSDGLTGSTRWLLLDLLDRQVIDVNQLPVGKVDDLHFGDSGRRPKLIGILSGAEALGGRIGGVLGRAMAGTARRMLTEPRDGPRQIPWSTVGKLGYVLELTGSAADLHLEPDLEVWLRDHLIGPIPGSGRASE